MRLPSTAGRWLRYATLWTAIVTFSLLSGLTNNPAAAHAAANCDGLSPLDCRLVVQADANISQETAFQLQVDFRATVSAGNQKQTLTATGTGALALDAAALRQNQQTDALTGLAAALQAQLHLEGSAIQSNSATGVGSQTLSQKAQFDVVVQNGIAYARSTGADNTFGAWQSTPLSDLSGQNASALSNSRVSASELLQAFQAGLTLHALSDIPGVLTAARTTKTPVIDGQPQAEISYTVDLPTLLASDASLPLIKIVLAGVSGGSSSAANISDSDARQAAGLLSDAIKGTTITLTRWIGTQDKLYHALIIDAAIKLDKTTLGTGQGKDTVDLQLALKFSQVGQPITVTAPPVTPTAPPVVTSPLSPNDAAISAATLSRFAGLPIGVTTPDQATGSFAYLGSPDAPLRIIQVSSYSCGPCRTYYEYVFLELLPAIRAGQVQYVFVPVTLTGEFDPTVETAAAFCALNQGKFWEMTDVLFNWQARYGQNAADTHRLQLAAIKLGLDQDKFNTCLLSRATAQRIVAANDYFNALNLDHTPSIVLNGQIASPEPNLNGIYQAINAAPVGPSGGKPVTPSATNAPRSTPEPTQADTPSAGNNAHRMP